MKKILFAIIALSVAQTGISQLKYGAQISTGLSSAAFKSGDAAGFKKTPALIFGIAAAGEYSLPNNLALRSSFGLLQKGVSLKTSGAAGISGKMKNRMLYLEIPVAVTYNMTLNDIQFFAGAGPSFGFGITGKSKSSYSSDIPNFPTDDLNESVNPFKSQDGGAMKRVELSMQLTAGAQLSDGLYLNASYLHGLNNLVPAGSDAKYKNRGFQITVGKLLEF